MERQQQLAAGKTTSIWEDHTPTHLRLTPAENLTGQALNDLANETSTNQNSHSEGYPLGVFRNYQQACFAFISPMVLVRKTRSLFSWREVG